MSEKKRPAKREKLFVDAALVEAECRARMGRPEGQPSLRMEDKKGFVRFVAAEGISVYVPKTKTVGRVDLSGFEMPPEFGGIVRLGGLSFGAVHQQLDFAEGTAEEIVARLGAVLDHMLGLPPREKRARQSRPGAPVAQGQGATDTATEKAAAPKPDGKKARAALIARVAAEKGARVSERTLAELSSDDVPGAERSFGA